ncbi:MAG: UvrD-helicase domain-containing protein [Raoultibacter sp.]
MDMTRFTAAQRQSVEHLEGPLFISAGAGSGKTFTLQQRIAYALSPQSGPALSSIDEVLAITFMEKAAAEIKARVRSALRAEGLFEEALKVDGAWISTIHGMCSRILHENALECGLDPAFTIVLDFEASQLRAEAIDEVLRCENEAQNSRFSALFAEYGTNKNTAYSVAGLLNTLLKECASFEAGLDAVCLGPAPTAPSKMARELLEAYESVHLLAEAKMSAKAGVKISNAATSALAACESLQRFLESGSQNLDEFMGVVAGIDRIALFGGEEEKQAATLSQQTLDKVYSNANATLGRRHTESLMDLAHEVMRTYDRLLADRAALDQNGLLRTTLRVLTEHPTLANRYRKQFKLVMVDEFQDTDQMQIDLITKLTGIEHLCTVGDAQQSIYRFRGADVHIYQAQRARMQAFGPQALCVQLDDNFRSHGDILAFVRHICAQESVFGSDFLDLQPARAERGVYKGSTPRIDLQLTTYTGKKLAAVEAEARGIAERFAALRAAGHAANEMVVLLGAMSNAAVYAEALRDEGFECIMVGGSTFYQAQEVRVIGNLVQALANPAHTEALFSVLSSPLLQLSADDFIQLATGVDEQGKLKRRSIDRGLYQVEAGDSALLQQAAELFARARHALVTQRPSQIILQFVVDAGWFARLEAQGVQGSAVASNILKALRQIEDLEQKPGYGMAQVARDFGAMMAAGVKDGQGSLAVENQNAVRIMTIHKSKGLEFPLVAVAAYDSLTPPAGALRTLAFQGALYLQLLAHSSAFESPVKGDYAYVVPDLLPDLLADPAAAGDPASFGCVLRALEAKEEAAEGKRRLYVALTRASECLIVGGIVKPTKDIFATYAKRNPLLNALRSALCGDADFPEEEALLAYGGSAPAHFARIRVGADEGAQQGDGEEEGSGGATSDTQQTCADAQEVATVCIPVLPLQKTLAYTPLKLREDVFSYSGIAACENLAAHNKHDDDSAAPTAQASALAGPVAATDLGTAFHRIAQYAVISAPEQGGRLVAPNKQRIDAIAGLYGVVGTARARLDAALARWFASEPARQAQSYATMRAEVPFFVQLAGSPSHGKGGNSAANEGTPLFMEGEIDLLCSDAEARRAFVIDYKTGGSSEESPDQLQEKHLLQATCYAYAILSQGYETADFAFVRVEQQVSANCTQPQVVSYHFEAAGLLALEQTICAAHKKASHTPRS